MRIFPRIHLPRFKRLSRRLRLWGRTITVRRAVAAFEWFILFCALVFLFTGRRVDFIDVLGGRADLLALVVALALSGLLHKFVAPRIVSALERYFSPAPYDERRILFDLGQQARAATNIDELYKLIVTNIDEALETENVSIFVRDDATGDYVCRISQAASSENKGDRAGETGDHASAPRLSLARDGFVVRRLQSLSMPLMITAADFDAWENAFSSAPGALREARARERKTLRQIKSNVLLQIKIKEQLVGILSLGPRRAGHPYSAADKEMLMAVAGQLAFVIENSRLVERMVAEERLRRELALAADVQQRLFPSDPPSSRSAEMAGYCQPARGVGGDYYDFLQLGNEQIGIALADVAGKGISAALVMSNVQASLRSQTMAQHDSGRPEVSLPELMSTMNRLLCRSTDPSTYVTFFYSQFDERTRQLVFVNAGHNPPLLLRFSDTPAVGPEQDDEDMAAAAKALADGSSRSGKGNGNVAREFTRLTTGGSVIGMFEDCCYEQEMIQLHAGDLLAVYTDGVTEALNAAGEEFGEKRLMETLSVAANLSADEVSAELVRSIRDWCVAAPQHDDLTFVVLKVK